MEPTDLTVRILQDIREEIRGLRDDQGAFRAEFREELATRFQEVAARYEVVETTLRDLAQQLVILGRGVKVAIERRESADDRFDDHEHRIAKLEKRLPG